MSGQRGEWRQATGREETASAGGKQRKGVSGVVVVFEGSIATRLILIWRAEGGRAEGV